MIEKSLAKRHRKEKAFRFAGLSAVVIGLAFVALLFGSILAKGLPAFWQTSMNVPVYFDPKVIDAGPVRYVHKVKHLHITKNVMSIGKQNGYGRLG